MAKKHEEISSTERLLDVIRTQGDSEDQNAAPAGGSDAPEGSAAAGAATPPASPGNGLKSVVQGKPKRFARQERVGVHISYRGLKLVKVSGSDIRSMELVGFKSVDPPAQGIGPADPAYAGYLAGALQAFVGKATKKTRVWAVFSESATEIWQFNLPRMSSKQFDEAVFWKARKEKKFDSLRSLLDFKVNGEVQEKGVPKLSVTAAIAPLKEVKERSELFERAGYSLKGLTEPALALQNLFRAGWLPVDSSITAHIHIGVDSSSIDIYAHGNLVFTRVVKSGIQSMADALRDSYEPPSPRDDGEQDSSLPQLMTLESEEEPAAAPSRISEEEASRILEVSLLDLPDEVGVEKLSQKEILAHIMPAVDRLVRQIERTFEYFLSLSGERVGRVFFSGRMSVNNALRTYIGSQLGLERQLLDPLDPESTVLSQVAQPAAPEERMAYVPALAAALSDREWTPNFLHTHAAKAKQRKADRIFNMITVAFVVLMVGVALAGFLGRRNVSEAKAELAGLKRQLREAGPTLDQTALLAKTVGIRDLRQKLVRYSDRYEALAMISEISTLTPMNIKLQGLTLELSDVVAGEAKDAKGNASNAANEANRKYLIVNGVVKGDPRTQDAALASYLIKLELSPLFDAPQVKEREPVMWGDDEAVLRFVLSLSLV